MIKETLILGVFVGAVALVGTAVYKGSIYLTEQGVILGLKQTIKHLEGKMAMAKNDEEITKLQSKISEAMAMIKTIQGGKTR